MRSFASDSIRILHVDDDPQFTDLTVTFLEKIDERFEVLTSTDARRGVDRIESEYFDCVVSDYDMPGMNGIEFLEAIRPKYPHLPFLLFTGKGSEEVASDAISAGVTDYLQKNVGTEQYELLANRISNAVAQFHAERSAADTQRQLRELTNATREILWMFSDDWSELLYVNTPYQEIFGRSIERLSEEPRDFLNGIHPDDRDFVTEAMETISRGESVDIEYRVNPKEDYRRWVWVQGEPIVDDTGAVVRVAGFARDITDRKHREQDLELMDHLVEEMNDGAVIVQDGVIKFSNPRISELTGFDEDELVEMDMGKFIAPDSREVVEERHFERMTSNGGIPPERYEISILSKEGTEIPVEINVNEIEYFGEPATVSLLRRIS